MGYKVAFIVSYFSVFLNSAYSQDNDSIVRAIFIKIYNQQYPEAGSLLSGKRQQIELFYYDILRIDLGWWKYITSAPGSDSRQFSDLLKSTCPAGEPTTAEGKIRQLVGWSYQLRLDLKRYNFIRAVILRSKIKHLLNELKIMPGAFPEDKKNLFALYDLLFRYFDQVVSPFSLKNKRAEREEALKQIEQIPFGDDLMVETLAHYFIGKIYLEIEKTPEKATPHFKKIAGMYPQNKIFRDLLIETAKGQ